MKALLSVVPHDAQAPHLDGRETRAASPDPSLNKQGSQARACCVEKAPLFWAPDRVSSGARPRRGLWPCKCPVNPLEGSPDPEGQRACVESSSAAGPGLGQGEQGVGLLQDGGLLHLVHECGHVCGRHV